MHCKTQGGRIVDKHLQFLLLNFSTDGRPLHQLLLCLSIRCFMDQQMIGRGNTRNQLRGCNTKFSTTDEMDNSYSNNYNNKNNSLMKKNVNYKNNYDNNHHHHHNHNWATLHHHLSIRGRIIRHHLRENYKM